MKAFISYSHRDVDLMRRFRRHLTPLQPKFNLEIFSDKEILPGEEWEKRIWDEFAGSKCIFVLVTVDFLNSEFCFRHEFQKALQRHKQRKAIVIPIVCAPCAWKSVKELATLLVLPTDGEPIRGGRFKSLDHGFADATNGINRLLTELSRRKPVERRKLPQPSPLRYGSTKFKAVFFDLDGTLVRGRRGHERFRYSWQLVWAHLGYDDADRRRYYNQYLDKRISYIDWCNITCDLFRGRRLLKAHFHQMAKKVRLTKNCRETLGILRDRGVKTILVSGGINTFLEAVFPDYSNFFDNVFINEFRYDDAGLLRAIQATPYDFEGKHDAILEICGRHNFEQAECVFVGEGRNDIYVAKQLSAAGGMAIGYPADLLRDYVDHELWKDRLDAILDVIFDDPLSGMKR